MTEKNITAVPGDNWWVRKWDVASASDPGKTYRVAQNKNGGWGCNCPRWKFRRQECRHIKLVKNYGQDLIPETGVVTSAAPSKSSLERRLGKRVVVKENGRIVGEGVLNKDGQEMMVISSCVYVMDTEGHLAHTFTRTFTAEDLKSGKIKLVSYAPSRKRAGEVVLIQAGSKVWAVVGYKGKTVRIRAEVIEMGRSEALVRSLSTEREYRLPTWLVFNNRPSQAIIETAQPGVEVRQ